MSLLDRFRKKETKERLEKIQKVGVARPSEKPKNAPQKDAQPQSVESKTGEEKKKNPETPKKEERKVRIMSERAYRSILRPLVTEKSVGQNATYVFAVDPAVNKQEIKRAIHVQNHSGKFVRYGRHQGHLKAWKKAIVVLKPGETIHVIEGL